MNGVGYVAGALILAGFAIRLLEAWGVIPTTRVVVKGRRQERRRPHRHHRRYYVTHGYGRHRRRRY